ncbi:Putative protein [Zobellia galactanivorans]|uniref:Uncharacterized protein n=1 Tax=Zobellia galactanivorans (strain DSM 12802 / CCUG 47099 / CIP 106680 / NCIMB 13871 / Dsij) TaxID=63186 RepID=G0L023_ZOBGA|nr:Putative protein [Zobellia galactanivorans]
MFHLKSLYDANEPNILHFLFFTKKEEQSRTSPFCMSGLPSSPGRRKLASNRTFPLKSGARPPERCRAAEPRANWSTER